MEKVDQLVVFMISLRAMSFKQPCSLTNVSVYETDYVFHGCLNKDFCKLRCLILIRIIECDIAFEGSRCNIL